MIVALNSYYMCDVSHGELIDKYDTELSPQEFKLIQDVYKSNPFSPIHVHINADAKAYKADDVYYEQLKFNKQRVEISPKKKIFCQKISSKEIRERQKFFGKGKDLRNDLGKFYAKIPPVSQALGVILGNTKFDHLKQVNKRQNAETHYKWMIGYLNNIHKLCYHEIEDLKTVTEYQNKVKPLHKKDYKEITNRFNNILTQQEKLDKVKRIERKSFPERRNSVHYKRVSTSARKSSVSIKNAPYEYISLDNCPQTNRPSTAGKSRGYIDKLYSKYTGDLKTNENMDMFYYKLEAMKIAHNLLGSNVRNGENNKKVFITDYK